MRSEGFLFPSEGLVARCGMRPRAAASVRGRSRSLALCHCRLRQKVSRLACLAVVSRGVGNCGNVGTVVNRTRAVRVAGCCS